MRRQQSGSCGNSHRGTESAERKSVAAHLDDTLALLQLANDFGPERFEPREEGPVGAVADTKPHNTCAVFAPKCTLDDVFVFGDNDLIAGGREIHDASVIGVPQPLIADGGRGVALIGNPFGQGRRQLRVDQEAHRSGGHEDRVVEVARGVGEAGADIFRFQVRIVRKDLLGAGSCPHR